MHEFDRPSELTAAIDRTRTRVAPDARVSVFDIETTTTADGIIVSGTVSTPHARRVVEDALAATTATLTAVDIVVLTEAASVETIADPAVPIRATPDNDAERVSTALYGMALTTYDERSGWVRIRGAGGHLGWIPTSATTNDESGATTARIGTDLGTTTDRPKLYTGTPCEVLERSADHALVRFRTGSEYTVPTTALTSTTLGDLGSRVLDTAWSYLGTPYQWGGMTTDGIDCSGLTWLAYWQAGLRLPRDSDQQQTVGRDVARDALAPGDLLFFPGHVALSTGGHSFIHASGSAGEVEEGSLDPATTNYRPELDTDFDTAKRIIHEHADHSTTDHRLES